MLEQSGMVMAGGYHPLRGNTIRDRIPCKCGGQSIGRDPQPAQTQLLVFSSGMGLFTSTLHCLLAAH